MHNKFSTTGKLSEDLQSVSLNHTSILERGHFPWKEDDLIIVILEKYVDKRTDQQNRYLHGVIIPCIQAWFRETNGEWLDAEEVKFYIYTSVLRHKIDVKNILGQEVLVIEGRRFSEMDKIEFVEAVEIVRQHFNEKGLEIPLPNINK